MKNERVTRLAYCEIDAVVLKPNHPYIFEVIPGCAKCKEKLDEANEAYAPAGITFDYTDPKTADLPIYATRGILSFKKNKKKKH